MIRKLNKKDLISIYDFINKTKDTFEDFFFTENKERKFIDSLEVINKLLKRQYLIGVEDKELKGVLIILREKGYRTYIKVLAENISFYYDLLKYLDWNFSNQEFFIKVKKENPINNVLRRYKWDFLGLRGKEILYTKKPKKNKEINNGHDFREAKESDRG